ncbi:MAG TPA: outer membrane beta-barrel protein [Puia sp.]|jgi:opacity protein-like surface antigen|nr:outer membrane beta-barrel protein [Puia sp.]
MKPIKILTFLTALCISTASFAQQKPANSPANFPANFIEVEGGVSLPLGNFGKTSTATSLVSFKGTINDLHGYAKAGAFGAVDGAWFFSKHFGLGGMFKYGTYNLKGVDSLSYGYEESFDVDTTRTTPTNYKMWSIMPGLYYNLAIAGKFAFTARALAGMAYATTPRIYVNIEDGGVTDPPAIQNSASKAAFAFDLGAGFRYNILKCLSVNLKADYFYTKPDFAITNSTRITDAGREISQYDQPLESINFSLGVAYQFGRKK